MNVVLKYPGAKNRLASWILEYIPEHEVYLEPYFGSGAVFFNKQPARIETINDLNVDVVNYFRVLRDNKDELISALRLTPYARDEYEAAYKISDKDSDAERARKFAVRCWQGFGCSNLYKNGFRSSQQGSSPATTKAWREYPETLQLANKRLLQAQIENLPAVELIKRYDTEDVFIYADPPYLQGTRKNYLYRHEMKDCEHEELICLLKKHPGKVLLSGYDNDMYNSCLKEWSKVSKNTTVEKGLRRTENLWMNYEPSAKQIYLFS
ncbi:site-specific DNA-adenine methylase [Ruminiclostridium sufflavum DSM 19573]|uniref:Site-specific DNA-adenine methylase n=1 Tax=Ruminiclostridium sufflavum DSM 19573 TaxID=1121337 RepID=A0A318XG37_9FIRM|nr:DNA adenine methylase [Ruminiclostridium sufflavum]PYG84902.1 site-specific DNA-adenine methylase [Ruminiclostridium sufflavum DSM 19573]